ncbi:MAG: DUF4231 domain-containing protein [Gaiellaceae bacterium]
MGDPTVERLEDQINWYEKRSARDQRDFKRLKYVEIVAAASIPVVTVGGVSRLVPAILGGLIVVIEAVLHLNQYQRNWLVYRATAETLKSERALYLAGAGHYAATTDPRALLAERVEGVLTHEHQRWRSEQDEQAAEQGAAQTTVGAADEGA